MNKKPNSLLDAFLAFLQEYNENFKDEILNEFRIEMDNKVLPPKMFYNLKEVNYITGLSIRAIKERYRRGTLQVVYDNVTPLIPSESLKELLEKLNRQIMKKKRAV